MPVYCLPRDLEKEELAPSEEIHDGKKVKATIPLADMRKVISEQMHRSFLVSVQLTNSAQTDIKQTIGVKNQWSKTAKFR